MIVLGISDSSKSPFI